MRKRLQAFTLIELLVTIAIIGVLSTLSLVAVNSVREAGRDAKRKTDVETIRTALELYKADCGVYPTPGGTPLRPTVPTPLTSYCGGGAEKVYLTSTPTDPVLGRFYRYTVTSTGYYLCAALEGSTTTVNCAAGEGSTYCGTLTNCTYETANP